MRINYKITIEYLGTGLVGWQIQKKGKSVQSLVENAIKKFTKDLNELHQRFQSTP